MFAFAIMLSDLISSKTRIKLLLKFFLNSATTSYLRGLADEFNESTNAVRLELNRLEEAGMLTSMLSGNKKLYQANTKHPMYPEIHNIVRKHLGIDKIIEEVIERLGSLEKVYLTGPLSNGKDAPVIDVIMIGEFDGSYLSVLVEKAESLLSKRIRHIEFTPEEWEEKFLSKFFGSPLLIWDKNGVAA